VCGGSDRPVGVDDAQFRQRRITLFAVEVVLAEFQVGIVIASAIDLCGAPRGRERQALKAVERFDPFPALCGIDSVSTGLSDDHGLDWVEHVLFDLFDRLV
jgi:hypothetical protein